MIITNLFIAFAMVTAAIVALLCRIKMLESKTLVLIEDCDNNRRSIDKLAQEIGYLRNWREGADPEIAEDW